VSRAGVSWEIIHELRQALLGVGIDWEAVKREEDARIQAARDARTQALQKGNDHESC
jgi:hypothetical protein